VVRLHERAGKRCSWRATPVRCEARCTCIQDASLGRGRTPSQARPPSTRTSWASSAGRRFAARSPAQLRRAPSQRPVGVDRRAFRVGTSPSSTRHDASRLQAPACLEIVWPSAGHRHCRAQGHRNASRLPGSGAITRKQARGAARERRLRPHPEGSPPVRGRRGFLAAAERCEFRRSPGQMIMRNA
jgi:hypothetical protein